MNELVSANWSAQHGMENPKTVLNKVSNFGALPINQHSIFFKNGATKLFANDSNVSQEIKDILEKERKIKGNTSVGEGSMRPCFFTEKEMSDLYYNSYGLDAYLATLGYGLDIMTLGLVTGAFTGRLVDLLPLFPLYYTLLNLIHNSFDSYGRISIPKIGNTDYYTYEKKEISDSANHILSSIVKRKHPYVKDGKIQKDLLINLCSQSAFKKITGTSSYDALLSKYQFNAGVGFTNVFRQINQDRFNSYIDNLKANNNIKYQQLNRFNQKYPNEQEFIDKSKAQEDSILDSMKKRSITSPLNIYIDFSDYIIKPVSSRQKGYPNPEKGKSIFGPYISRSKRIFFYYPKIIISNGVCSSVALASPRPWGDFTGYVKIFGVPTTFYSIVDIVDNYATLITQIANLGLSPTIEGEIKFLSKDKAFNLGAAYTDNTKNYNSKPC